MSAAETMNIGLRRRSCQASDQRLRGLSLLPVSAAMPRVNAAAASSEGVRVFGGSCITDPRVENGVEKVHEQIGEQVDDDQNGHERHDGRRFTAGDRLEERATDAVNVEDPLGHDRSTHPVSYTHLRAHETDSY